MRNLLVTFLMLLPATTLAHQNCFESNREQFETSWFNSIRNDLIKFGKQNHILFNLNTLQLEVSRIVKNTVYGMSDDYASYLISLQGSLKTAEGTAFAVFTGDQTDFVPLDPTSGVKFRPVLTGAQYDRLGNLISAGHCQMEKIQSDPYDNKIIIANAKSGKVIGGFPVTSVILY